MECQLHPVLFCLLATSLLVQTQTQQLSNLLSKPESLSQEAERTLLQKKQIPMIGTENRKLCVANQAEYKEDQDALQITLQPGEERFYYVDVPSPLVILESMVSL